MQKVMSKNVGRQRTSEAGFWHNLLHEPGLIHKPKLLRWLSVLTTGTGLGRLVAYFVNTPQAEWRTVTITSHVVMLIIAAAYLWWIMAWADKDYNKIVLTAGLVSSTAIMVAVTLTSGLNVSPGFFLIILYWIAAAVALNWRGLVVTLLVNAITYAVLAYLDAQGWLALRQITVEWVRLMNAYLLIIMGITTLPLLLYSNIILLRQRATDAKKIADLQGEVALWKARAELEQHR